VRGRALMTARHILHGQSSRRRRWTARPRWAVVAGSVVAAVAGMGTGAAFGYFAAAGSGTGGGSVGTMQTVTLTAVTGTPATPLVPGGTGDVVVSVHNPNRFAVSVTSVVYEPGATIGFDAGHGGCTTGDSQPVVGLSVPGSDLPVAVPASSSATFHLANAVTMEPTATSNCQGATISIPVVLTVRSS
jgi:hypothetical protein